LFYKLHIGSPVIGCIRLLQLTQALTAPSGRQLSGRERTRCVVALTCDFNLVASRVATRIPTEVLPSRCFANAGYVCAQLSLIFRHVQFLSVSVRLDG